MPDDFFKKLPNFGKINVGTAKVLLMLKQHLSILLIAVIKV